MVRSIADAYAAALARKERQGRPERAVDGFERLVEATIHQSNLDKLEFDLFDQGDGCDDSEPTWN
jgi:hypothetical protein